MKSQYYIVLFILLFAFAVWGLFRTIDTPNAMPVVQVPTQLETPTQAPATGIVPQQ